MDTKLVALAAAAALVLSVFAPTAMAAVDASGNDGSGAGNAGLSVNVAQTGDSVDITVTDGSDAAAGASVTVESVDNAYVGAGTYTADENGGVSLPAPTQDATVKVTATYDGETATTTVELTTSDEFDNFGQEMSAFVHRLMEKVDTANGDFGKAVSDYATSNNPGADKKPEHAGPPDDRGKDASGNGNGNGNGGGPPDHANGNGNGNGGGPPDHANGNGGNNN